MLLNANSDWNERLEDSSPPPEDPKLRQQRLARAEYERAEKDALQLRNLWVKRRFALRALAEYDVETQASIRFYCASTQPFTFPALPGICPAIEYQHGVFFFFDWFVWTYDPRSITKWVPFILYQFQIELVLWLIASILKCQGSIDRVNGVIEKARDMGISWLLCAFVLYWCLFLNGDFLIGSRKEEEVDKKGDLDTPFQKIREIYYRLPHYLQAQGFNPREHDKERLFLNPQGGQIVGESANSDFGRGGRNLFAWMDEIQSWEYGKPAFNSCSQSTNFRLVVGTADGMDNILYALRAGLNKIRVELKSLIWRLHPIKGAGLHLDENNKWMSPWYQEQIDTMEAEDVAAEIDIQYDKSARGVVFKTYVPEKHAMDKVEAMPRGEIIIAQDPGQKHYFAVWVQFDEYGRVLVLRELHMKDARLLDVGRAIKEINRGIEREYPMYEFSYDYVGDPQGATRTGAGVDVPDYETLAEEFEMFIDYDFILDIPTNQREKSRHTAIKNCLNDFIADTPGPRGQAQRGTMKFLVDKTHCPETHKALMSGYRFKTDKNGKALPGEQVAENRPANDAIDCLGYAVLRKWGVIDKDSDRERFDVDDAGGMQWGGLLKSRGGDRKR